MSSIVSRALFLILFLSCAVSARAQDEPRHALVIGNADYQLGVLPNPINDARSMAAVLVETGFRTTVLENVTKLDFETGVAAFLSSLPEGSVGLFYFAGHGIQKDGRNYLLPVDAQAGSIEEVIAGSISASDLVTEFHERGIDFGIFILGAVDVHWSRMTVDARAMNALKLVSVLQYLGNRGKIAGRLRFAGHVVVASN